MIHWKEGLHKELIPFGIWGLAVIILLVLIYLK